MLRRSAMAEMSAAMVQPVSFVAAIVLGYGVLSAPYAIAILLRRYLELHFAWAGAIAIGASVLALGAAYVATRHAKPGSALYLPVFGLVLLSLWGNAILFGA